MEELGSSSGSSSKHSTAKRQNFMLHVLSPSADFPNKITFPDVPTSGTVGELKLRIWKAVDSGPSPDLQRLIYRGKPLAQDTALLKDVITQETIDRSESISVHLVLPPAFSSKPSIPSAPPKSPHLETVQQPEKWLPSASARRDHDSEQIPTRNADHREEVPSPPLPQQPPPAPSSFDSHDIPSTNIPNNIPSHLPAHVQQALTNHLQSLFQHFAPQFPANGNMNSLRNTYTPPQNNSAHNGPDFDQLAQHPSNQSQPAEQPNFQSSGFSRTIAPEQHIRAAAGLHGLDNSHFQQHTQLNSAPMPLSPPIDTYATPGTSGNNRIVPQSTLSSSEHSNQEAPTRPPESDSKPQLSAESSHRLPNGNIGNETPQDSLVEEKLSDIESALAVSSSLHESIFETLRNQLLNLQSRTETSTETLTRLSAQLEALSGRAEQLRVHVDGALARVVGKNGPSQRPHTPLPGPTSNNTISNAVYLLSSPSGPQALLVSPSGLYTAPWNVPSFANVSSDRDAFQAADQPPDMTNVSPETRSPPRDNVQPPQARFNPNGRTPQSSQPPSQLQPQMEQQQQQQQAQPEQQEQANQLRDLARALVPMGGHIWLLVRLFGFVYFFTGGGGHIRTIFLGLCALIVFVAQSGIFRPFLQSIWEPLRQHMENLLPLAANDRIGQGANAGNNANRTQNRNASGAEVGPTPHQAAERLLREQELRDGSIIRQNLRRLERALALFVASLVPGVGERHIAARDAAEAARREEERLREENARKEEEEKERLRREQKGKGREDAGRDREPVRASHEPDPLDTTTTAET